MHARTTRAERPGAAGLTSQSSVPRHRVLVTGAGAARLGPALIRAEPECHVLHEVAEHLALDAVVVTAATPTTLRAWAGRLEGAAEDPLLCALTPDGAPALAESAADFVLPDGGDPAAIAEAILRRLERRRADRLHRRVGALINASPDAVLVVDESGVVQFVNNAAVALFDRSADSFMGERFAFSVADGEVTEIEILRRGRMRSAEMRVVRIAWEGGPAVLATLRDVTERRQLDERLRQSEKLEAIGRLAAGVAHDFNNILQGLIGNLELIEDELAPDSPAREYATLAIGGALHGAEITSRLLSYARRQMLQPRAIDVRTLLHEVRSLLTPALGANLRLVCNVASELPPVQADAAQLHTALLNLVLNAADAMPDGGTITIEARLGAEQGLPPPRNGTSVLIAVSDTGVGMDAATLEQAFEPFFSTKGSGGTGLGLPMVQGFARQSGGDVRIESTPNQGTRVTLWLPCAAAPAATADRSRIEAEAQHTIP